MSEKVKDAKVDEQAQANAVQNNEAQTNDQANVAQTNDPEPKKTKKADKEPESTNIYNAEYYEVELELSENKKDDVMVGINGMNYQIKRGEKVKVPAAVYEILENSRKMDSLAFRRTQEMAKDFQK